MPRRTIISRAHLVVALCVAFFLAPLHAAPPSRSKEWSEVTELVHKILKIDAAKGVAGNRRELLAELLGGSPDCTMARWHSGYVEHDGKWRTPEEVQAQLLANRRWQEYQRLRAEATATVNDQIALAQWCRKNKLEIEERFHWFKVLEVEPDHAEALARFRLRWIGGMLLTPEQHERYLTLRRKLDDDVKTWKPRVIAWQRAIENGTAEERQAALEQLSRVTDPAAVLVLEWSVRSKDISKQATEFRRAMVATLARMKNQPATEALVRIAATAAEPEVCDAAADALKPRPIPSYAPLLLTAMTLPVESKYTISSSGDRVYYRHRFFRGGEEISNYVDEKVVSSVTGFGYTSDGFVTNWVASVSQDVISARNEALKEADAGARSAEIALAKQNQVINERNQRLKYVLTRASGINLPADPEKWWNWWQGYLELNAGEKPARDSTDDRYLEGANAAFDPRELPCCIRGTPVWTLTGKKPIESVQIGDRVLSQNPDTGELAYMPVLRTIMRPEAPTIQIKLPGETLTATRGYNFWSIGSGWALAKNLKAEAMLYGMPGNVKIQEITDGEPAEGYNLIVADYGTYFVGENRILAHDNTLPAPGDNFILPGIPGED